MMAANSRVNRERAGQGGNEAIGSGGNESFVLRFARWSARHRRRVVFGWVVLVVLALGACVAVPANTHIQMTAPGQAGEASRLLESRFNLTSGKPQEIVVFKHPSLTVDSPEYRDVVQGLMARLRGLRTTSSKRVSATPLVVSSRVVSATITTYDTGLPAQQSPFVSHQTSGDHVTFAIVQMEGSLEDAEDHIQPVLDTVRDARQSSPGFDILIGGDASIQKQTKDMVNKDMGFALILNLPITFVILILAFGALVAAAVPLALAFAAIIIANGSLALISQGQPLSEIYTEMVLLMGLATGIDYSLFVISRYRAERGRGSSKEEALHAACATSGKAVFFAGVTVLLAIAGMFLVQNVIFTSLAIAAIVVVALAVLTSFTLLPAILAMLGDNVDRLRVPFLGRARGGGGVWGFISDRVLARPAILASLVLVMLIVLAVPIFTFNLGFNGARSLSDDVEAKKALIALQENFTLGLTSPAVTVIDAGKDQNIFAPDVQAKVNQLQRLVQAETVTPDNRNAPYGTPVRTNINDAGDTEMIQVPLNADTGDQRAIDAVNHIRNDLIPQAFGQSRDSALVTGATAANIDFRKSIIFHTPFVFAFVLGLAFVILLVTFRSLVIAVKAIILNLLSVGAAYGLLVLVFQRGWLLEPVFSFKATGIIESWLPLFLFSILFGLSMDYHMFIMGRIKEAHERGLSNDEAISLGVKATAGTITNAAAIMVAVAIIFAFTREISLKQFGFGLAAAIFIDATVIRSVLLPASMKLLGERNWYLPRWLEWMPHIRMTE